MDAKDTYSKSIQEQKAIVQNDAELSRKIKQGEKRKIENGQNWKAININDTIKRFAPGIQPKVNENKVEWFNPEAQISIIADIGGGYLRIQDKNKPFKSYLGLKGKNIINFTDKNGKQLRRLQKERESLTHFKIYYRSKNVMDQHELILVPKRDFDENTDCWQSYANNGEFDDFFQWWFSLSENESLWQVYQALNDSLNAGIDHYEDAEISANNVEKAISIAESFRNRNAECCKKEPLEKLMQAFQKAKELGQPIYFWF